MSLKTGKKLGFFAALTMLIGSVVGIGIFFKSHGILRANDWNGTGTLLAWLIGGLLSLAAAVSFAEIGSMKTGKVSGIAAYSEQLGGKKFGYFVRFNFSFFYMGLLVVVLGFFGSEILIGTFASLTQKFKVTDVPLWGHALTAVGVVVVFVTLNVLSVKASGVVAQVSTILKWVPLVLVAVLGIALATTNKHVMDAGTGKPYFGHNAFTNGREFTFTGMLAALPAVLFAYDSFLNVLSMKDKVEGGTKKLPKIVVTGMIATIVLYMLIALAAILHGSGMVSGAPFNEPAASGLGIFDQIFKDSVAEAMGKFVIVFLAISTLGVINGITAASISVHEQAFESNTVFGSKSLKAKLGEKWGFVVFLAAINVLWVLVLYIPTSVMKTDAFIDGASNFPTLFFFAIYAIVILLYTLKRNKLESKKINNILFKTFAWIAIVGIFFVVGYQLVYGFFIKTITDPHVGTSWGLYVDGKGMEQLQTTIMMFTMLAVFFAMPLINWWATKKFEKNEVVVNTQD